MDKVIGFPESSPHYSDWVEDCMFEYGYVLSGENCHWCDDWDYLPIDNTCPEYGYCTCFGLLPVPPYI